MSLPPIRYGFQLRKIWFATLAILISFSLFVGVLVSASRANRDAFSCLRFAGIESGKDLLLDLNTRTFQTDSRLYTHTTSSKLHGTWISPDGRYGAYLLPDENLSRRYTLYLQSTDQTFSPVMADKIATGLALRAFAWSPDSSQFLYLWRSQEDKIYFAIMDADGGNRREQEIVTARRDEVSFFGWSGDSGMIAISTIDAFGRILTFYDVQTLKRTTFPIFSILQEIASSRWAPNGRRLAYMRTDQIARQRLVIALLDEDQPREIAIDTQGQVPFQYIWSPSGKYVALAIRNTSDSGKTAIQIYRMGQYEPELVTVVQIEGVDFWFAANDDLVYMARNPDAPRYLQITRRNLTTNATETSFPQILVGRHFALTSADKPEYSQGTALIFYERQADSTVSVFRLDPLQMQAETLIQNATSIDDPLRSPDNQGALLIWQQGKGTSHQALWLHLDEDTIYSYPLSDVPTDETRLWFLEQHKLVFVSGSPTNPTYHPTLLELTSGQIKRLPEYAEIRHIENPSLNTVGEAYIGVAWRSERQNISGYDYFNLNGELIVRFTQAAVSNTADTYFIAPTEDRAVVFMHQGGRQFQLVLARSDSGDWVRISNAVAVNGPIWAEDGSRFAQLYLNVADPQYLDLEIYTNTGQREHRFEGLLINQGFLQETRWTQCR